MLSSFCLRPSPTPAIVPPVPAEQVIQDVPSLTKRSFRGDDQSQLTVWYDQAASPQIQRFEFRTTEYFCQLDRSSGVLEIQSHADSGAHEGKSSNPVFDISGTLQAEVRQLFRWTLPNLAAVVPDDVRAFLQHYAT